MDNLIHITFDGPRIGQDGVSLDDFQKTLLCLQAALRQMIVHIAGVQGRAPEWVRNESFLRLKRTFPGSLGAELYLSPPPDSQTYLEDYGGIAIDRITRWQPGNLGTVDELPEPVVNALKRIRSECSSEVTEVTIGNPITGQSLLVPQTEESEPRSTPTLRSSAGPLFGWLNEVNWDKCTAQLHRYADRYILLRFEPEMSEDMLRHATRFVQVKGTGRLNKNDQWSSVRVEQITGSDSMSEMFDLKSFEAHPNPKIFDPDLIITTSEPYDVDEYIRLINEARETGLELAPE